MYAMCVYIYIYTYICIHIRVYIYIYISKFSLHSACRIRCPTLPFRCGYTTCTDALGDALAPHLDLVIIQAMVKIDVSKKYIDLVIILRIDVLTISM